MENTRPEKVRKRREWNQFGEYVSFTASNNAHDVYPLFFVRGYVAKGGVIDPSGPRGRYPLGPRGIYPYRPRGRHPPPGPRGRHLNPPNPEADSSLDAEANTPLDPEADNPIEAGGTHPTGMHSCTECHLRISAQYPKQASTV